MKFLKSVKEEMKLVQWPTAKENRHDTLTVILTTFMFSIFLGLCDWIFAKLVTSFAMHK
ncbi:preprotein translocase subunit SecE [Bombilactobacillus thymidiniphilus]|uniref:Protein translocase subunit SecE n=1 Tax=Bombilactobacillus thymidiniphilus TaxID=2923363 RepID=A0ABY4PE12_9LACO|nr:preprotein translocase subunit SecE [Bombilactobacillus thymidiniphilus]UQS83942.1 preprotein translocase subunit SecE [Bombilactobacillus thymidiniphilus]